MASQEQANATNPSTAVNLTSPTSLSSQSNNQAQLTSSLVASAVTNTTNQQLQQLQKQANQVNGQAVQTASVATFPHYNYNAAASAAAATGLPAGYTFANAQYGFAAYDPKAVLAAASKLKVLPTPTGMKLDQRFAPY